MDIMLRLADRLVPHFHHVRRSLFTAFKSDLSPIESPRYFPCPSFVSSSSRSQACLLDLQRNASARSRISSWTVLKVCCCRSLRIRPRRSRDFFFVHGRYSSQSPARSPQPHTLFHATMAIPTVHPSRRHPRYVVTPSTSRSSPILRSGDTKITRIHHLHHFRRTETLAERRNTFVETKWNVYKTDGAFSRRLSPFGLPSSLAILPSPFRHQLLVIHSTNAPPTVSAPSTAPRIWRHRPESLDEECWAGRSADRGGASGMLVEGSVGLNRGQRTPPNSVSSVPCWGNVQCHCKYIDVLPLASLVSLSLSLANIGQPTTSVRAGNGRIGSSRRRVGRLRGGWIWLNQSHVIWQHLWAGCRAWEI